MAGETGVVSNMAPIMAKVFPRLLHPAQTMPIGGWLALVALSLTGSILPARAQESPNQPEAINGPAALVPSPCRLVVPANQSVLQPMKIRPEQVALKNRLGCLSPADAIYGPDGCPLQLCGKDQGAFQLPPP